MRPRSVSLIFGPSQQPAKGIFSSIKRLRTNDRLSYGELVALSGDFYGSPVDLYEEKPAQLAWLWEDNDLEDLRRIFKSEIAWIEDMSGAMFTRREALRKVPASIEKSGERLREALRILGSQ